MLPVAMRPPPSPPVRSGRFWVFTHAEFKAFTEPRFTEILDAFPDP